MQYIGLYSHHVVITNKLSLYKKTTYEETKKVVTIVSNNCQNSK